MDRHEPAYADLGNTAPWLVGERIVKPHASAAFGTLDASGLFVLTGVRHLAAPALVGISLHAQGRCCCGPSCGWSVR